MEQSSTATGDRAYFAQRAAEELELALSASDHEAADAHRRLQRVYTEDRTLDETLAAQDRDTVLVPRGYHTVSAPPGYALYYLNVMAGPTREWAIKNDPDHEWTM